MLDFITKKREKLFEILFCFIACGIIGWIFETTVVLVETGVLTDRGILFISFIGNFPVIWGLPFILIYGVGGAVLIWGFKPLAKNLILLVVVSIISMTLFEYLAAVFCELVLGQKLWDYSNQFMNFQGRICLTSSLAWGVLSILAVKVLGPFFLKLYDKIEQKEAKHIRAFHVIKILIVIYIFVCYLIRPVLFPDMV